VSSAAHQFGRSRVLCEIFGVSGHSMSFEDQKWISDFHFVLGINFMCQHLVLYSFKGERKRDYPPTFSYHQPYWQYYRVINDYMSRCGYITSIGRPGTDILLLHPLSTGWCLMGGKQDSKEIDYYDAQLKYLLESLLAVHRDFDFGDESIMENHLKTDKDKITIGKCSYKTVIVPPSLNWSRKVFGMLSEFEGPIIFTGKLPSRIDGELTVKWNTIFNRKNVFTVKNELRRIQKILDRVHKRDISIIDNNGKEARDIYCYHRVAGKRHIFFLSNKNRTKTFETKIFFRTKGRVTELNPFNGETSVKGSAVKDGYTVINTVFHPVGSRIFSIEEGKKPIKPSGKGQAGTEVIGLKGPWRFKRTHLNSITLDKCRVSFNRGGFSSLQPVWKIKQRIWKFFDIDKYDGIQPWALKDKKIKIKKNNTTLKFEFHTDIIPDNIFLVMEHARRFKININGRNVKARKKEWYFDRQFLKIDIAGTVKKGKNIISLLTSFKYDTEIEEVYIVGDFGVSHKNNGFVIVPELEVLKKGDWCKQGYPFYAGNMIYYDEFSIKKKTSRSYLVDLSKAKGSLFKVTVNGKDAGFVICAPWTTDIKKLLKNGNNRLEIEVIGTLRNSMGPLHHTLKDKLSYVGPFSFSDEKSWTKKYSFVPYGLSI
jgi:hypothetical protein